MRKLSMVTIAALATIIVFCSVLPANAIIIVGGKFGMVGIVMGQTARLNVVNITDPNLIDGDARSCSAELMFFDSEGEMLAMMMVSLDPGVAMFHDLRFPAAGVEGRFQIRAEVMVMGDKKSCDVIPTLEIYDNETMKTEVFWGDPEI